MPSYLQHIVTANPSTRYPQSLIRDRMKEHLADDRRTSAIIHTVYKESGIEFRHSVVQDYGDSPVEYVLFHPRDGVLNPSTGTRNEIYQREAGVMFVDLAKGVLDQSGLDPSEITHVITVSCTGFFAPGPDFEIVQALGLPGSTQRFHLGFMGCYAAFPALRMAHSFCEGDPHARVLIVSVELCTLHFQSTKELDHMIGAAIFGDGGAGLLVSGSPTANAPSLESESFANTITETGKKDMAWTIGDHGFDMILSSYVPDIIEANLEEALAPLFVQAGLSPTDITTWGLHPGGRSIVDKVEASLGLGAEQLEASRYVLANYGNMSSATVLFVLQRILASKDTREGDSVLGLAFGPGLSIESGLFRKRSLA